MNRNDVWVIESAGSLGLCLEAVKSGLIARKFGRKEFDGNLTFESRIAGQIDLGHPTRSQMCENLIAIKPGTASEGHKFRGSHPEELLLFLRREISGGECRR